MRAPVGLDQSGGGAHMEALAVHRHNRVNKESREGWRMGINQAAGSATPVLFFKNDVYNFVFVCFCS